MLNHKIDFSVIITAKNANPNGDPLNGNRPREASDGCGEISDACIKRKIRNRLQDNGEKIFLQSEDHKDFDGCGSMKIRAEADKQLEQFKKDKDRNGYLEHACRKWFDVRSFGQAFPFSNDRKKGKDNDKEKGQGVSFNVRGPVSIQIAQSVSPIEINDMKITSSVNNKKDVNKEGYDRNRFAYKHFVTFGMYIFHGSINCQLAEKTGFSDEDAQKIKDALCTLFENDASSARPEGSMEVCRVYWWEHDCKTPKPEHRSARLHRALKVSLKDGITTPSSFEDYDITLDKIDGIEPEIIDLM